MQNAIELLMTEHRLIESVLDALDAYANALERGDGYERSDLARFVTFAREFADDKHHQKEEKILFTTMQDHGFPRGAGPVAVMEYEHGVLRNFVATLADVASTADWASDETTRVIQAARSFARMLRQHIDKEDTILYPMSMSAIPAPAFETINQRCAEVERQLADSGATERLEALAAELTDRYRL